MSESSSVCDATGAWLFVGDVVQIDPEKDEQFPGAFMTITDLKPNWDGIQGFITDQKHHVAYYRLKGRHCVKIGQSVWDLGGG